MEIIMLFVGVAKYFRRNWKQKRNYKWVIELKLKKKLQENQKRYDFDSSKPELHSNYKHRTENINHFVCRVNDLLQMKTEQCYEQRYLLPYLHMAYWKAPTNKPTI